MNINIFYKKFFQTGKFLGVTILFFMKWFIKKVNINLITDRLLYNNKINTYYNSNNINNDINSKNDNNKNFITRDNFPST